MRVLLSLDLEPTHERLFEAAATWVQRLNARLDLLYVLPFAPLPALRDPVLQAAIEKELRSDTTQRKVLGALLHRLPEAQRGSVHTRTGAPADEIKAMSQDYDALLVGTNGRSGVERFWLGSVAEKVVRQSDIPVVVLPLRGLVD